MAASLIHRLELFLMVSAMDPTKMNQMANRVQALTIWTAPFLLLPIALACCARAGFKNKLVFSGILLVGAVISGVVNEWPFICYVMGVRLTTLIICALLLGACSQSDTERARAQAHQTAEQAKHDSRVALDKAEVEAKKANKELNQDLNKAREKVRGALDEPEDRSRTSR